MWLIKMRKAAARNIPGRNYQNLRFIEGLARRHIEEIGYTNTIAATSDGPDIIGHKFGKAYNFEVKLAFKIRKEWFTAPVYQNRIHDHFIAIILPNRQVYIQPMPHHLQACNLKGLRNVNHLIRRFCPDKFEGDQEMYLRSSKDRTEMTFDKKTVYKFHQRALQSFVDEQNQ